MLNNEDISVECTIQRTCCDWAIPCQRSEKKGQRQKVDFLMKCERL